jgi:hypothetical protein
VRHLAHVPLKGAARAPDTNCAMGDFQVKKIILPSGKAVEIVYFHAEPVVDTMPTPPASGRGLEACPDCASGLVYPIDWHEADSGNWELELRCPECEWSDRSEYDQATVERYDGALNDATDVLIESLEQLTRENMEAEIERFVSALSADHIVPFDF